MTDRTPAEQRVIVFLPTGRRLWLAQDGRVAILRSRDFALVDGWRPFDLRVEHGAQPVRVALAAGPETARLAASFTAVRVDGGTGAGAVAYGALRAVGAQSAELSPEVRRSVAQPLVGLVALALVTVAGERSLAPGARLARAAQAEIERSLADPGLSRTVVAGRLSISVGYLDRLMAAEGLSFGRALLEARLARCHAELTDPLAEPRPISELASDAGFRDPSYFSRAYKRRYAMAPMQTRLALRPAPALRQVC